MTYGLNSTPPDINPAESWMDYTIRLKQTCGIGTIEAGRIADKQVLLRDIDRATNIDEFRNVLRRIVAQI